MTIITLRTMIGLAALAAPCAFALWKFYPHPKFKRVMQDFGVVVVFAIYVTSTASLIQSPADVPAPVAKPAVVPPAAKTPSVKTDTKPYDLTTIGDLK